MKRRMFNLLAAVSLTVLTATVATWLTQEFRPFLRVWNPFEPLLVMVTPSGVGVLGSGDSRVIGFRYWQLALLVTPLPLIWVLLRTVKRRPANKGLCICGYDLRASKERCPECGMAIPGMRNAE